MRSDDQLRMLGIDGETGRSLTPLAIEQVQRWARNTLSRVRPLRYGVPSHSLHTAGWGVVLPEGCDPCVREALDPLLHLRQKEAGARYRELTYLPGESTLGFRQRVRMAHGRVEPRQMPWYLLIAASPSELPHGFEMDLDVPCAVGRLAFDDLNDLAAYAERIAKLDEDFASQPPLPVRPSRALVFAPTHPDEPATEVTAEHLARPLWQLMRTRGVEGEAVIGRQASRAGLLERLQGDQDLFVFAGHAVQYRSGHALQRSCQGALLCSDWPGPKQWPGGSPLSHTVPAADLPDGVLADGIALLFGCHTLGTSRVDLCQDLDPGKASIAAPEPFTSALAQRLLGRSGGALGVIGHVGRAFEAGIHWRDVSQINAFEDAVVALLDGCRLGEALDGFGQRFADLAVTWAQSRLSPESIESPDLLDLWIALYDARSWCLLGDPAARLPSATRSTSRVRS